MIGAPGVVPFAQRVANAASKSALCGCAGSSVYVAIVWSTGSPVEPRSDARPFGVGFEEFWWRRRRSLGDQPVLKYYLLSSGMSYSLVLISS